MLWIKGQDRPELTTMTEAISYEKIRKMLREDDTARRHKKEERRNRLAVISS